MASLTIESNQAIHHDVIFFGRALMFQISNVYALRMAGVLMVSLATIWWRTQIMPRWLVGLTYLLAVALLLVVSLNLWITLLFPAWVFLVSVYVLFQSYRGQRPVTARNEV